MFARRGSPEIASPARARTAGARAPLDLARRARYAALLRRWVLDHVPAGAGAGSAADGIAAMLAGAGFADASRGEGSVLVRLRALLLADRSPHFRARVTHRSLPSSRVEQLVGRDHLDAWERALDALPRRQRELVILRVEFGLDDASIAAEVGLPIAIARAQTVNALAALIDALGCGSADRAA